MTTTSVDRAEGRTYTAVMFAARRLATSVPAGRSLPRTAARGFQSTSRAWVNVGDSLPDVELVEDSPGNKVNLARELRGKGVVIGVPAAFSTSASQLLPCVVLVAERCRRPLVLRHPYPGLREPRQAQGCRAGLRRERQRPVRVRSPFANRMTRPWLMDAG